MDATTEPECASSPPSLPKPEIHVGWRNAPDYVSISETTVGIPRAQQDFRSNSPTDEEFAVSLPDT